MRTPTLLLVAALLLASPCRSDIPVCRVHSEVERGSRFDEHDVVEDRGSGGFAQVSWDNRQVDFDSMFVSLSDPTGLLSPSVLRRRSSTCL